jgi:hypothetical protein
VAQGGLRALTRQIREEALVLRCRQRRTPLNVKHAATSNNGIPTKSHPSKVSIDPPAVAAITPAKPAKQTISKSDKRLRFTVRLYPRRWLVTVVTVVRVDQSRSASGLCKSVELGEPSRRGSSRL